MTANQHGTCQNISVVWVVLQHFPSTCKGLLRSMLPPLLAEPMIDCVRRESKDRRRLNAQAKVLTFYNSVGEWRRRRRRPPKGQTPSRCSRVNLSGPRTTGFPAWFRPYCFLWRIEHNVSCHSTHNTRRHSQERNLVCLLAQLLHTLFHLNLTYQRVTKRLHLMTIPNLQVDTLAFHQPMSSSCLKPSEQKVEMR